MTNFEADKLLKEILDSVLADENYYDEEGIWGSIKHEAKANAEKGPVEVIRSAMAVLFAPLAVGSDCGNYILMALDEAGFSIVQKAPGDAERPATPPLSRGAEFISEVRWSDDQVSWSPWIVVRSEHQLVDVARWYIARIRIGETVVAVSDPITNEVLQ